MSRKIFRSGNSTVVSIPQESLDALGLDVGSEVEVVVDEERGRLILRPTADVPGVRDTAALESAVARPRASYGGEEFCETACQKAAALLHSLLDSHPFVDGNKRTAITAAGPFLEYNGRRLTAAKEKRRPGSTGGPGEDRPATIDAPPRSLSYDDGPCSDRCPGSLRRKEIRYASRTGRSR